MSWKKLISVYVLLSVVLTGLVAGLWSAHTNAQDANSGPFNIQVTPTTIIETVKPGESKTIEIKIHNQAQQPELLKAELRNFQVNQDNGEVQLLNTPPPDVKDWVSFSDPTFTVQPGDFFTEHMNINTPQTAGFSYTFATVISRANPPQQKPGARTLVGSVAIFSLLSVDRPGAVRKFEVTQFKSTRNLYEYLPATFSIKIKNTGNTFVRPVGNIFIQRGPNSPKSISTLTINQNGSYVLPNTTRSFATVWNEGFPNFEDVKVADNAPAKRQLTWDWSKAQNFRIGHYNAKMVAVYNDGKRDIPVEASIGFWVLPWKLLIIMALVILILLVGIGTIFRRAFKTAAHQAGRRRTAAVHRPTDNHHSGPRT